MADSVSSQTVFDGIHKTVMRFTCQSDGTGETAVVKVDPAVLNPPANRMKIMRAKATTVGMEVLVLWEAAVNRLAFQIPANEPFEMSWEKIGGLYAPADLAAPTGRILFTTTNFGTDHGYTVTLEMVKKAAPILA